MPKSSRTRTYLTSALKITIACVLVYYLLKSGRLRVESVQRLLHPESIPFLVISALAFVLSQVLSSVRMMFLLNLIQLRMSLPLVFKLTMIGNFFNVVVPGTIGGDLVKGYYLVRNEGSSRGRSSGIVIIDRMLGLISLCVIGTASAIFALREQRPGWLPYDYELWGTLMLGVLIFGTFAVFVFISKHEPIRHKLRDMILKRFPKGFFHNVAEGLALVTKKRRYLSYALLISLAAQGVSLAGLLNLLNLSGEGSPDLVPLVAASSIVMLMGVIPVTPGNIGWTEFLAALGWSALGAEGGAETFLTWRIITVACSLLGGWFYLTSSRSFVHSVKIPEDERP